MEAHHAGDGRVAVEQDGAQPFGVGLSDEATLRGRVGDDFGHLENFQLLGGARGAINLQFITGCMDGRQADLVENTVEDLGQTAAFLTAHIKTGNVTVGQFCLGQVGLATITSTKHRRQGRRRCCCRG